MMNESENETGVTSTDCSPRSPQPASETPRKPRGFAKMDPQLVSELAKRGGVAVHRAGTAHRFTPEEARAAGRKGGMATHEKRRRAKTSVAS
jgi:general stress protein YciG